MRSLRVLAGALIFSTAMAAQAATLTVTTDSDEANCNCNGGACCPNAACVHTSENFPPSTGCSLREALQNIADKAGTPSKPIAEMSFPECGLPDTDEQHDRPGHTSPSTSMVSVPDPADNRDGVLNKHNTQLPFIADAANAGTLSITGGTLSCEYDASVQPVVGGNSIFHLSDGADVSFQNTSFQNCKAPADGVAIVSLGSANLNLDTVTFLNIHAINEGHGGCISHGNGNLTITAANLIGGSSFTTCIVDNNSAIPGGGNGQGGALYISNAGGSSKVLITNTTFQGNIAGESGGAIYFSNTDAIAITTSAFQGNIAAGNTNPAQPAVGNAEVGGGAIYATGTATGSHTGGDGFNLSTFLIFQTSFIGNTAPVGTGGAILLTGGGKLTYGTLSLDFGKYSTGDITGIPGGVIASNFSGNVAGGTSGDVPIDARAGSGGAIYASGYLAVLASSFDAIIAPNASTNGNGGAIAYHDAGDSFTPLAIANVTFSGNKAGANGGAIANIADKNTGKSGQVVLINDTIDGNTATGAGGGLYNANTTATEFHVANSIVSNNTGASGANCGGQSFTDDGGNVQFNPDATCGAAKVGDPLLAGAAPFGGVNALVAVMQLGDTSAAQGAGVEAACDLAPIKDLDARLHGRPDGKPLCDAGAYESGSQLSVHLQSFEVK